MKIWSKCPLWRLSNFKTQLWTQEYSMKALKKSQNLISNNIYKSLKGYIKQSINVISILKLNGNKNLLMRLPKNVKNHYFNLKFHKMFHCTDELIKYNTRNKNWSVKKNKKFNLLMKIKGSSWVYNQKKKFFRCLNRKMLKWSKEFKLKESISIIRKLQMLLKPGNLI